MSKETRPEELRQILGRMYEDSIAYKFWRGVGRTFTWIPGLKTLEIPLYLSSLLVILLSVAVCSLVARLTGALEFFSRSSLIYVASSSLWAWMSIIIAERMIVRTLRSIQNNLPDILELPQGEIPLGEWVGFVSSRRNQVIAVVTMFVLMSFLSSLGMRFDYSQPTGWILALHLTLGVGYCVFFISWVGALILFFAIYFNRLSLRLFADNPSATLPLTALHRSAGQLMLVSALIAALAIPVGVLTTVLTSYMLMLSAFTLWIPLLAFYVAMEHGFSIHIRAAKSGRLSDLQEQISLVEKWGKVQDVGTAELLQRMLEIHEGVRRTPNSLVNVESLVNLLGSLALPLLGGLINIFEKWRSLFGLP